MSQRKQSRKAKKTLKNKLVILAVISLAVFMGISCGFIVYHYNDIKYWNNLIYPKVFINNTDLSGKTKLEAKNIIKKKYSDKIGQKKINIIVGNKKYELLYSNLKPSYNVDEVVNQAYSYGKDENVFKKYRLLKKSKAVNYELKLSYDVKPVKNLVSKIESEVNSEPINASLKMRGTGFEVIPQQDGVKLKKEDLEKQIVSKIDGSIGQNPTVQAKLQTIPASIKGDELKTVNTLISNFSTNYGSISSSERANNIALATKSINGYVVMPGDTFSFNGVVGQRTAAKGYQAAPVIVGDKVESGLGGGICQVSTTLYNAVYKAGLTSTERVHHTLPVHYVPEGMDATVDYGNIDYKFRNDFKYPVYIEGYTSGGNVAFNLYSNSAVVK